MTQKTSSSFTVCHNFALEINYFPVLLSVRALLARLPKRSKRKVVSGSRVTLPENFACKPGLSFNPLARVTLAVGLPYLLVNRALLSGICTIGLIAVKRAIPLQCLSAFNHKTGQAQAPQQFMSTMNCQMVYDIV